MLYPLEASKPGFPQICLLTPLGSLTQFRPNVSHRWKIRSQIRRPALFPSLSRPVPNISHSEVVFYVHSHYNRRISFKPAPLGLPRFSMKTVWIGVEDAPHQIEMMDRYISKKRIWHPFGETPQCGALWKLVVAQSVFTAFPVSMTYLTVTVLRPLLKRQL